MFWGSIVGTKIIYLLKDYGNVKINAENYCKSLDKRFKCQETQTRSLKPKSISLENNSLSHSVNFTIA